METGTAFWYGNAAGLAGIAVNRGSAVALLGLAISMAVEIRPSGKDG